MKSLTELVGEADAVKFLAFTKGVEEKSIEESTILDFSADFSDKVKRTEIHQFFKKYLKKWESDTLSIGDFGKRSIRVFFKKGMSKNKRQKNGMQTHWGSMNQLSGSYKMPEYLSVALQKTNTESI